MTKNDVWFLVGAALVLGGLAAIFWPLALIVAGGVIWSAVARAEMGAAATKPGEEAKQ